MEYAARLTRTPSRKTLVAPLVALVVGAAVADSFFPGISKQSGGIELRGSKASSTGTTTSDRGEQLRSDPHGTANSLRNP